MLISGDEPLLVSRAISRTIAAVRRDDPDAERRDVEPAGLSIGEFNDAVAPSLFAEPRVVVLHDAQDLVAAVADAVISYVAEPIVGVTLVVHHTGRGRGSAKTLPDVLTRAQAAVFRCPLITKARDRVDFVRAEIRNAGGVTTPAAVAALIDAVGNDIAELAAAADQLVADSGGTVDEAAVNRYYRGRANVTGFEIADLIVAGQVAPALESLRWALVMGEPPVRLADAMASGVRTVAKVAGNPSASPQQLASVAGVPPWKVDKLRRWAKNWSAAGLRDAMEAVARLNSDVKGGAADPQYALERAVMRIGRAQRRHAG